MPLIWWWNKYNTYHGLSPSTTPGHTIATLNSNGHAIAIAGVELRFHHTLRVPDSEDENRLPLVGPCRQLVNLAKSSVPGPGNHSTCPSFQVCAPIAREHYGKGWLPHGSAIY
jgi:hypothetical protein